MYKFLLVVILCLAPITVLAASSQPPTIDPTVLGVVLENYQRGFDSLETEQFAVANSNFVEIARLTKNGLINPRFHLAFAMSYVGVGNKAEAVGELQKVMILTARKPWKDDKRSQDVRKVAEDIMKTLK